MQLEVKIQKTPSERLLLYQVKNTEANPVLLFTKLYRAIQGQKVFDAKLGYRYLFGSELLIEKALIRIPDDMDVSEPEYPFSELLSMGSISEGAIEVPIPLCEYAPYHQQGTEVDLNSIESIQFRIGYVVANEEATGYYRPSIPFNCYHVDYGYGQARQQFVGMRISKADLT